MPIEQMRRQHHEIDALLEWFNRYGYARDILAIQNFYPGLKSFRTFPREMSSRLRVPAGRGEP
jgi:hypothetical protein